MSETVRAGSSTLLHIAGPVLGCAVEKGRSAAGTIDRCGHAFVY